MEVSRTITARGRGFWGYSTYEIEFHTCSTVYGHLSGYGSRTVNKYILEFNTPSGSGSSDHRTFKTHEERKAFAEKHFSNLTLKDIPEVQQVTQAIEHPLKHLCGEYLSSVTFLMDYLQIGICGGAFTFYNWPVISSLGKECTKNDPGYRDELCCLIGKTIRFVDVLLDAGLVIEFEHEVRLSVPLRPSPEFNCPEIAEYGNPKGAGIIWMTGEEPFEG